MSEIFLSYRRLDSEEVVGRIGDHLVRGFGARALFIDVQSIDAGADYPSQIRQELSGAQVVLVVIGKRWLTEVTADGRRRIDAGDDFVRREIELALTLGKLVIPVLVGGAEMPAEDSLPDTIRGLASRSALPVRPNPDFDNDVARLIRTIVRNTTLTPQASLDQPPPPEPRPSPPIRWFVVGIVSLTAASVVAVWLGAGDAPSPATWHAQGKVVEARDGRATPVAGATIRVDEDANARTTSRVDGTFDLNIQGPPGLMVRFRVIQPGGREFTQFVEFNKTFVELAEPPP
jgi:hypothetical protein